MTGARRGGRLSPWILTPHLNPNAALRVFCLPYAGGDTWIFHDWHRALPDYVEVCPIRLPGRGSRIAEPPFSVLDDLVEALGAELDGWLDCPFVIFGHSMGALIGFELVRHLRRTSGRLPLMLCVGACQEPQNVSFRPPISKLGPYIMLEVLRGRYGAAMDHLFNNEALLDLTLPIMRADFSMVETYAYVDDDPLDCPIVAYRGTADATLNAGAMRAWQRQTSGIFRQHEIVGDHFFLTGAKPALLQTLAADLDWSIS